MVSLEVEAVENNLSTQQKGSGRSAYILSSQTQHLWAYNG